VGDVAEQPVAQDHQELDRTLLVRQVAHGAQERELIAQRLVFLPMANKLKAHINRLIVQREIIVDGLVGIANGDNPRIIESRLQGYIF